MRKSEKALLRGIIKMIPIEECDMPIACLWRDYAPEFSYATFKNYFKVFNKKRGLKWKS